MDEPTTVDPRPDDAVARGERRTDEPAERDLRVADEESLLLDEDEGDTDDTDGTDGTDDESLLVDEGDTDDETLLHEGDTDDEALLHEGDPDDGSPLLDGGDDWVVRWTEIQAGFVDEPRRSIENADALVDEVIETLTARFADERARLESQWTAGSEPSTEELRVALQRYRSFFNRLLAA